MSLPLSSIKIWNRLEYNLIKKEPNKPMDISKCLLILYKTGTK